MGASPLDAVHAAAEEAGIASQCMAAFAAGYAAGLRSGSLASERNWRLNTDEARERIEGIREHQVTASGRPDSGPYGAVITRCGHEADVWLTDEWADDVRGDSETANALEVDNLPEGFEIIVNGCTFVPRPASTGGERDELSPEQVTEAQDMADEVINAVIHEWREMKRRLEDGIEVEIEAEGYVWRINPDNVLGYDAEIEPGSYVLLPRQVEGDDR